MSFAADQQTALGIEEVARRHSHSAGFAIKSNRLGAPLGALDDCIQSLEIIVALVGLNRLYGILHSPPENQSVVPAVVAVELKGANVGAVFSQQAKRST